MIIPTIKGFDIEFKDLEGPFENLNMLKKKSITYKKLSITDPCSRKCYEVHLWAYKKTTTQAIRFPAKFVTLLAEKKQ